MLIETKELTKTFQSFQRGNTFGEVIKSVFVRKMNEVHAVNHISFGIEEGELLGFLGPNGAGKSTTLKMLTGIMFPTSGTATIMGYTPWKDRKKYVANIGAVFGQKSQLLWDIPPIDAFYLNKAIYDIPTVDFQKRFKEMVDLLDIGDIMKKPTRQLSLGERMKCEFVMAMLHNPKIVFLDEPTIGLDVIAKEKIREFILRMNALGVTFILTTHDLDDVEHLARRVIVINHGEVAFDNDLDHLRSYTGTRKNVCVSTRVPLPNLEIPGVDIISRVSPTEAELSLDVTLCEIGRFIQLVNEHSTLLDLSVSDPPIEEMIKTLYGEKKAILTQKTQQALE